MCPQEACQLRYYPGRAGTRRNPGRMDKLAYNGSWFICPADVDGRHDDSENDASQEIIEFEDIWTHEGKSCCSAYRSFFDRNRTTGEGKRVWITRPSNILTFEFWWLFQDLQRIFEIIDTPRRVIALEDDENVRECAGWRRLGRSIPRGPPRREEDVTLQYSAEAMGDERAKVRLVTHVMPRWKVLISRRMSFSTEDSASPPII